MTDTDTRKVALYARVSTGELPRAKGESDADFERKQRQHLENQMIKLRDYAKFREWSCDEYQEHGHGDDSNRPILAQIMRQVEQGRYKALVVLRCDRAARDSLQIHRLLKKLKDYRADFVAAEEGLDSSTDMGEAMIKISGIFGEMDLRSIRKRVQAGMDRAKLTGTRSGKPIGRPKRSLSPVAVAEKIKANPGISQRRLAKELGVPRQTLRRYLHSLDPGIKQLIGSLKGGE
jgi:DNA invertase Pin-like site-specific DNA recombinase